MNPNLDAIRRMGAASLIQEPVQETKEVSERRDILEKRLEELAAKLKLAISKTNA